MTTLWKSAKHLLPWSVALAVIVLAMGLFDATPALAHCDGLDGPVVNAARWALQTGDLSRVLIWVRPEDSSQIKKAFDETLAIRKLSPQAQALADMYFFETLVRVHRAGEGAPYTGLKPAGRDLGPAIPAADKAVETGAVEPLIRLLTETVRDGLNRRYHDVLHKKGHDPHDLAAGRRYIAAYVELIHYVERLYEAAAEGHFEETPAEAHGAQHRHAHMH
jgi:hypothetical protein